MQIRSSIENYLENRKTSQTLCQGAIVVVEDLVRQFCLA